MRASWMHSCRGLPGSGGRCGTPFVLTVVLASLVLGCTGANPAYHLEVLEAGAIREVAGPSEGGPDKSAPGEDALPSSPADVPAELPAAPDVSTGGSAADVAGPRVDVVPSPPVDAAAAADVPSVEVRPGGDASADAVENGGCGTAVLDVSAVSNNDGIAIGHDGTLYFTRYDDRDGWVGRIVGQSVQPRWLRIPRGLNLRGLAIDHARKKLYLADESAGAISSYDLSTPAAAGVVVVSDLDSINDLALDAAGTIYFSGTQLIYRVAQGQAVVVSTSAVGDPAKDQGPSALAFAADGSLVVGIRKGGQIIKMILVDGVEVSRAPFGSFDGWTNGLAFDRSGRLYAGLFDLAVNTSVVRIAADGLSSSVVASGGRFASLAFGRGSLDCRDLYIANPAGPMMRVHTDTPGLPLP